MRRKRKFLAAMILLILLLLGSIPMPYTTVSVDISHLSQIPVLEQAYQDLCREHSLYDIQPDNTIRIVTVRNLWGSWQRYVLPCFAAEARDVPTAGNATFTAYMHVLSPWLKESVFTKLSPLKLGLNVYMTPGENSMVSHKFDTVPDNSIRQDGVVVFDGEINCNKQPETFVYYTVATSSSAEELDQQTSAVFAWKYFLKLSGKELQFGEFAIEIPYIVNR